MGRGGIFQRAAGGGFRAEQGRVGMVQIAGAKGQPHTTIVGGWKTIKGGKHIIPPEHTPLANVLATFMDRINIPVEHLGNATGKLVEI